MSQALFTGATGLLAHQKKLDIVANNLANLNTTGYKSQRILFSDLVYNNISSGSSGGNNTTLGGTNPKQIGFGVNIAQTGRNFNQGVLNVTGSSTDFSIEGNGFFVVSDGSPKYTRSGAFSLDEGGFLVDPGTGAYVQRHGSVGEGFSGDPAFQTPGVSAIRVPLGAGIEGRQTSTISFQGNLPSTFTLPRSGVLIISNPFETGDVAASASTLLNDLDSTGTPYTTGDQIQISGSDADGTEFSSSLAVDETTTLGDLVDFFNSVLNESTAELTANGGIEISADEVGPSMLQMNFGDASTNSGESDFSTHIFALSEPGKGGDRAETTMAVYDSRGEAHATKVTFEKIGHNTWNAFFELIDESGVMLDSVVEQIEFTENGEFLAVRGLANGDTDITIQFDSLSTNQTIDISFAGLAHRATSYSIAYEPDGYSPGNIVSINASADGTLEGVATNGQRIPIAQLAIANFVNVNGLRAAGQNYFEESANSGLAQVGTGATGANGFVRGGQLESSNVDVALEFTQLIVAQRGFSANARTITVASEVLAELTNIIR